MSLDQALEGILGASLITQATGERILQGAAQARGVATSEANEDTTRDWKLDSKKFGERAVKLMLVLTAQLAMSSSLRVDFLAGRCVSSGSPFLKRASCGRSVTSR